MAKTKSIVVTVSVLTTDRLARALQRIGPGEIERMAFSAFARPERYIGDPADNVLAEDPFPMASLADAILRELDR